MPGMPNCATDCGTSISMTSSLSLAAGSSWRSRPSSCALAGSSPKTLSSSGTERGGIDVADRDDLAACRGRTRACDRPPDPARRSSAGVSVVPSAGPAVGMAVERRGAPGLGGNLVGALGRVGEVGQQLRCARGPRRRHQTAASSTPAAAARRPARGWPSASRSCRRRQSRESSKLMRTASSSMRSWNAAEVRSPAPSSIMPERKLASPSLPIGILRAAAVEHEAHGHQRHAVLLDQPGLDAAGTFDTLDLHGVGLGTEQHRARPETERQSIASHADRRQSDASAPKPSGELSIACMSYPPLSLVTACLRACPRLSASGSGAIGMSVPVTEWRMSRYFAGHLLDVVERSPWRCGPATPRCP